MRKVRIGSSLELLARVTESTMRDGLFMKWNIITILRSDLRISTFGRRCESAAIHRVTVSEDGKSVTSEGLVSGMRGDMRWVKTGEVAMSGKRYSLLGLAPHGEHLDIYERHALHRLAPTYAVGEGQYIESIPGRPGGILYEIIHGTARGQYVFVPANEGHGFFIDKQDFFESRASVPQTLSDSLERMIAKGEERGDVFFATDSQMTYIDKDGLFAFNDGHVVYCGRSQGWERAWENVKQMRGTVTWYEEYSDGEDGMIHHWIIPMVAEPGFSRYDILKAVVRPTKTAFAVGDKEATTKIKKLRLCHD